MSEERFRVALIFTPSRLRGVGVTAGDYEAGSRFIAEARPQIDSFIRSLRDLRQRAERTTAPALGEAER